MGTRGVFIAFEGGEGAGKSTQIRLLEQALAAAGHEVTVTREPGGSRIGERIRDILLNPSTGAIDPRTEALLFAADRAEHVATVIAPALDSGHVLVTDRYMDSSAAYQGAGRGLAHSEIINLSMWAVDNVVPDLTILLDLDPMVGLGRATRSEYGTADRFESEKIEFARAVRDGFLTLAAQRPQRYLVLDATQDPEAIASQVWQAVSLLVEQPSTTTI